MATATKTFRFLTTKQVIHLHQVTIANATPTQPELLESAITSPMNVKHYTGQHNIFQLAASLSANIMKNHAFMDGNKRTALEAANLFIKINGYELQKVPITYGQENKSIADAHVAVVTNTMTTEELGKLYQRVAIPVNELAEIRDAATEY